MKRPKLSDLTLREKIGQTGFPGVRDLRLGVINNGGYAEYFTRLSLPLQNEIIERTEY